MILEISRPLVSLDLETTGVDASTARIVEIGLRKRRPDGTVREWRSLINPGTPIPPGATAVHGITDADVSASPRMSDVGPNLYAGLAGCDFLGFRVRYDLDVLAAEAERLGIAFDPSDAAIVDGSALWRLVEPRTLSDFVRWFAGREHDGAHGAIADVAGAEDGIEGLLARHPGAPRTPREIHDACFPPDPDAIDRDGKFRWRDDGVPIVAFGKKWKGVPMAQVARGYYEWMIGAQFAPDARRIARDAIAGRFPIRKMTEADDGTETE